MIPNELNPNMFYRSFNDYHQVYNRAQSLQGEVIAAALKGIGRRVCSIARRVRESIDHNGTPHVTAN